MAKRLVYGTALLWWKDERLLGNSVPFRLARHCSFRVSGSLGGGWVGGRLKIT
jgi:hypothetical protein